MHKDKTEPDTESNTRSSTKQVFNKCLLNEGVSAWIINNQVDYNPQYIMGKWNVH